MTATESIAPRPTEPEPAQGEAGPSEDGMGTGQWVRLVVLVGLLVLLTATSGIWGVVVVLGIVAMVFLHELGHFIAAKRAGMMVTEFFLGFGPRIWSFRRGETEYGLKVIPAGAYVKIIGMHNLEEVAPADEGRAYRQGRFRDRFSVVVAGVSMNFAAALVLIWVLLAVTGAPGGSLTKAPDPARWAIGRVYPGSGADQAGIRAGDKIVAVEGTAVREFTDIGPLVRPKRGETVDVTVRGRDGATRTVGVDLAEFNVEGGRRACCLGVQEKPLGMEVERVNPVAAVPRSFAEFGTIAVQSVQGLGRFFTPGGISDFGRQVVDARQDRAEATGGGAGGGGQGSASGGRGSAEAPSENRLLSLVGVFGIATQAADAGAANLLFVFALLNIFLGVINLVPILPFDGGHIAIAVYERVQEWRHRQRTRYFADVGRLLPLTYVVVLVLFGIFITTLYLDVTNPLTLPR